MIENMCELRAYILFFYALSWAVLRTGLAGNKLNKVVSKTSLLSRQYSASPPFISQKDLQKSSVRFCEKIKST